MMTFKSKVIDGVLSGGDSSTHAAEDLVLIKGGKY
jgi:hypothetical protein